MFNEVIVVIWCIIYKLHLNPFQLKLYSTFLCISDISERINENYMHFTESYSMYKIRSSLALSRWSWHGKFSRIYLFKCFFFCFRLRLHVLFILPTAFIYYSNLSINSFSHCVIVMTDGNKFCSLRFNFFLIHTLKFFR